VRGDDDGGTGRGRSGDEPVDDVAARLIEPGVGLVEQPQLRATGDEGGERGAPALAGRQLGDGDRRQPLGQPQDLDSLVRVKCARPRRPGPEPDVLGHGQVLIERGGVTEQADPGPHRGRRCPQVGTEYDRITGDERHEAGERPQQGRLARAVRPLQQDRLAAGHVEVDTGQGREAAQPRHGSTEMDDGLHDRAKGYRWPVWATKAEVGPLVPFARDRARGRGRGRG
jgi:hypothetical protein